MKEDWNEIIYSDAVYKVSTSLQKLKQKQYLKSGDIPIVDQGQDLIGGYTNDKNRIIDCDLPVIVFGDHTKIIKLIDFPFAPGADGTKILEPSKFVLPKYLSILTKILAFKIKDNGYARHYQHIEKEFLPLAPLPVQRAIVSKIEALFSDLDNGIANFKKAQEQLKIYRQAVLKKAFEGELTKEWREKQTNLPTAEELLKQIKEERQNHYNQQIEDWKKAVKDWVKNGQKYRTPR
jgi:type I restriction enzyme S subunit